MFSLGDFRIKWRLTRGQCRWVWKLVRVSDDLFASASEDGTVKLWHARTYAQIGCLPGTVPLRSMAASPDGKRLVAGDVTGRLRVWIDLEKDPRVESECTAHRGAIRSVVFLGADTIASGGEDYRMHIWRGRPWRSIYQAEHENFVTDIVTIDDQRCASACYDGEIRVHQ
jgi:WD40 repeat protein